MTKIRMSLTALMLAGGALGVVPVELLGQKRERDRITREEILSSPHHERDLFEAIRSLRPRFLQPPPGVRTLGGSYGPPPVAVYVDGTRAGGLDALRNLRASEVEEVRYMDAIKADSEFGPSASGGAVAVKLYKVPRIPIPARDSTRPPRR